MFSTYLDCQTTHKWRHVRTLYTDNSGKTRLSINVSPFDDSWHPDETTKVVPLTVDWAKEATADVSADQVGTSIRTQDSKGMDVVVGSGLGLADTMLLVSKLKPFGGNAAVDTNLWKATCHPD
jgi:hypothetical protein